MAQRTVDNGRLTDFNLEIEAAPSGNDIQVTTEKQLEPIGQATSTDRRFTVTSTARNFPTIPSNATRALISVEVDAIRWRDGGQDPAAGSGHILKPPTGDSVYFWILGRTRITNFRMIRVTTDATVEVSFYQ